MESSKQDNPAAIAQQDQLISQQDGLLDQAKPVVQQDGLMDQAKPVFQQVEPESLLKHHRTNFIEQSTEFINDHLRLFRMIPWVIGGVGVAILIRYSRLPVRRLKRVMAVPESLIQNNEQLSGIVMSTNWNRIGVWHVPPWRRLLRWRYRPPDPCPENELLTVQFAGVAIGQPNDTESWLDKHLYGQWVWLTLIDRVDNETLTCAVFTRKNLLKKRSVNEQLLGAGLGSLDEVTGFKDNKSYIKFMQQLGKNEHTAKRKGVGLWEGSEYMVWWRRLLTALRIL